MIVQIDMPDYMFEKLFKMAENEPYIFKRVDPKARWTMAEKKRAVRAVLMATMSEFVR